MTTLHEEMDGLTSVLAAPRCTRCGSFSALHTGNGVSYCNTCIAVPDSMLQALRLRHARWRDGLQEEAAFVHDDAVVCSGVAYWNKA